MDGFQPVKKGVKPQHKKQMNNANTTIDQNPFNALVSEIHPEYTISVGPRLVGNIPALTKKINKKRFKTQSWQDVPSEIVALFFSYDDMPLKEAPPKLVRRWLHAVRGTCKSMSSFPPTHPRSFSRVVASFLPRWNQLVHLQPSPNFSSSFFLVLQSVQSLGSWARNQRQFFSSQTLVFMESLLF